MLRTRSRPKDVLLTEVRWLRAHRIRLAFDSGLVLAIDLRWPQRALREARVVDGGRNLALGHNTLVRAAYLARTRGRVLRGKRPPPWPSETKKMREACAPPPVSGRHVVLARAAARALKRSTGFVHRLDFLLKPTRADDETRCYDVERVLWLVNVLEQRPYAPTGSWSTILDD